MSEFELTAAVNQVDSRLKKTKRFQRAMVGLGFAAGITGGILVANKAPTPATAPLVFSPLAASAAAALERRRAISSCQGMVIKFAESQGKDARSTQAIVTRVDMDRHGNAYKRVLHDPGADEFWGSKFMACLASGITPATISVGAELATSQLPPGNFNGIATGLSIAALAGTTVFQYAADQSFQEWSDALSQQLVNIDGALPEL